MNLLEIQRLKVAIKQRGRLQHLVRDFDLTIGQSEVCGLVGESGAGKSMVAKTILDLLPGNASVLNGKLRFNGEDLNQLSKKRRQQILGKDIALIPQDPMVSLNPSRKIGHQIVDGLQLHLNLDNETATKKSLRLLEDVLIKDPKRVFTAYSHELSGGMRQRVLIAMAFSCQPKLIIADEPTTALDVTVQKRVLYLIRKLQQQQGTSLLFITHDLGVVAKICDRVIVMYDGRVMENSSAEQLFKQPKHQYTAALLKAMPRFDQPDKPIQSIPRTLLQQLERETARYDQNV